MIGVSSIWTHNPVLAVSDICTGVSTVFAGTAPATVDLGQSFSLIGITTRPATSYGVTVNSSSLKLSATNVTTLNYNEANTSTDPSPTTGEPTYTGFFPDWGLTATGIANSKITIKLVEATADVEGIGPITCPLSETLAVVTIVNPIEALSEGPIEALTDGPIESQEQEVFTPQIQESTPDEEEAKVTQQDAEETPSDFDDNQTGNVTVSVVYESGAAVKGADVTLDGQLNETTDDEGKVTFKNIRHGEHSVRVIYDGNSNEQTINVGSNIDDNNLSIIIPSENNVLFLAIAAIFFSISAFLGFLTFGIVNKKHSKNNSTSGRHPNEVNDQYQFDKLTLQQIETKTGAKHKEPNT